MPVVPLNTITGPSGARLPRVGFATPQMAESYGRVAGALSESAGAADGAARAVEHGINLMDQNIRNEDRRLESNLKIRQAQGDATGAMWKGMASLGDTAMKSGIQLDRVLDIRAEREADAAAAEFKNSVLTGMYGQIDPATGTKTPGTLDTPFSPSSEGSGEPSGAQIATAKMIKEWHENPDGTFSKLSPRAKQRFQEKISDTYWGFMNDAERKDRENYQAYTKQQNMLADAADKKTLATWGSAIDPQGFGKYIVMRDSTRKAAVARVMQGVKDPEREKQLGSLWMHDEDLSRIDMMASLITAEPDPVKRKQIADHAITFAEGDKDTDGRTYLLSGEIADAKVKIATALMQAQTRDSQIEKQNNEMALDLNARWLIHGDAESKRKLEELRPSISPIVMAEIDKTAENLHYKREMAAMEEAKASYVASIGTPNQAMAGIDMRLTMMQMTNQRAKIQAAAEINGASKQAQTASQTAMADYLEKVVYFGGEPGPDGSFKSYTDAKLADMVGSKNIPFDRFKKLMEGIAARQDRDPVIEKKVYETIDRLIGSDIDQAFKLQDGVFEYETRTEKGRTMPAVESDAVLGEVKTGDMRWGGGFAPGGWKRKERTVKLKAELVRNIAQDAYDWYRQQKVLSKPGPGGRQAEPADIETFIRNRLMPENHEDARAWTEADIEARIQIGKDEREQMRLLILEQFSASQMTQPALP